MKRLFYSLLYVMILVLPCSAEPMTYSQNLRKQYGDIFKPDKKSVAYNKNYAKIGEKIFFDTTLSKNGKIGCVTCHHPEKGFGDGLPLAIGNTGKPLLRKSMTLYNVGDDPFFFWDGRAKTLEEQFLMAIANPDEMALSADTLMDMIKNNPEYQKLFKQYHIPITTNNIAKSTADYVRTIKSPKTKFDDWIMGDDTALTQNELKGFEIFNNKANCTACHLGHDFTDNLRNDIGLPDTDKGYGLITKNPDDNHFFKTTGLRGIATRSPYMHNGAFKTLNDVINHYNDGTFKRGDTDIPAEADQGSEIAFHNFTQPLNLTEREKKMLIDFLKTL